MVKDKMKLLQITFLILVVIMLVGCTTIERWNYERKVKDAQYQMIKEFENDANQALNDLEKQRLEEEYAKNPSIEKENDDINSIYLIKHLVEGEDSGVFLINDGKDNQIVLSLHITHFRSNKQEEESDKKVLVSISANSKKEIIRECLPSKGEQTTDTQGLYRCQITLYDNKMNVKNLEYTDFWYVPKLFVMGFGKEELAVVTDYNTTKETLMNK